MEMMAEEKSDRPTDETGVELEGKAEEKQGVASLGTRSL